MATHLKEGEKAPDFNSIDQYGNTLSLKQYSGFKIILFFYPKALTPGCTMEAKNLSDNYELLTEKGFRIIGISADDEKKQLRFCEKHQLQYPLIPDTEKKIIKDYGVWGLKKMYGREYEGIFRTSFVIDEQGKIEKIISKVKTKEHTQQILDSYK